MNSTGSAPTGPTSALDKYMDMVQSSMVCTPPASVEITSHPRAGRGLGRSTEASGSAWRDRRSMTEYQDQWLMQQAWVDGDVVAIDDGTWAIHGVIPVDGEVILTEFGTLEEAQAVLERIGDSGDRGASRGSATVPSGRRLHHHPQHQEDHS